MSDLYRGTVAAYNNYEDDETVECLTDDGWPEDVAEQFVKTQDPLYEVSYTFDYDAQKGEIIPVNIKFDGKTYKLVEVR